MKLLRIVKILRLKDLRIVMGVLAGSMYPLFWSIVFITFVLYMSSLFLARIVLRYLAEADVARQDREDLLASYGSIGTAMFTLLQAVTGDWDGHYNTIKVTGHRGSFVFVGIVMFFTFALWNVVMSLFIERAVAIAKPDMDELVFEQHQRDMEDVQAIMKIVKKHDDGDCKITLEEFMHLWEDPQCRAIFSLRGIGVQDGAKFFKIMQAMAGTDEIDNEFFVSGCMRMKGVPTGSEIYILRYELNIIRNQNETLHIRMKQLIEQNMSVMKTMTEVDI
jgi:hypothetical protein